jgi:threonine/homoserine/homoserine lactone efflux protein
MNNNLIFGFALFAAATSVTPGPNNTLLLAAGLNYGVKNSWRHVAGINVGFPVMVLAIGLGLHTLFDKLPILYSILRICGGGYLSYLAWRLATTPASSKLGISDSKHSMRPIGFWSAAGFQWINPKCWIMALGACTTYLAESSTKQDLIALATLWGVIGVPCSLIWVGFGRVLSRYLQEPQHIMLFNRIAAAVLIASLFPLFIY